MREVTDKPILYLVNTNYHGDHTFGNYVFPEDTLIVAHRLTAERMKAGLEFARRIVIERGWVSDQDLQRVRDAGYSDGDIAEITATVAATIFSNYFNHIAQTEVDFPPVKMPVAA